MELYRFTWGILAWMVTVAVLWPVNIPLLALAYKVWNGAKEIDMEKDEFWLRSTLGSLVLALVTLGMVFLDYMLVDWAEIPSGPVHLIILMGYVALALWMLFLFYALSEPLEGLSIFALYVFLPIFCLFVLHSLFGLWKLPLGFVHTWLKQP